MLILLLVLTPGLTLAQQETNPDNDTTNLINVTLFPKTDPFQSDQIINVTLEFDMKKFVKTKQKGEYHKAMFSYQDKDSLVVQEIKIRARGYFRKAHCSFPPIKLNFKETEFDDDYMNNINSLKLVTHCKGSTQYEQYLLK